MPAKRAAASSTAIFEFVLRLADDRLVLGHRLSEWCGHAPILEEELALGNVALDLIGQASALLALAGEVEGRGRSADDLAYFRDAVDYRNLLLVEQPNGDFARTIARQFLFDAFDAPLTDSLRSSVHGDLASWAGKAAGESRYHLRHSREWVVRLGDGTEESHRRMQAALDDLWTFTAEPFEDDEIGKRLAEAAVTVEPATLSASWNAEVRSVLDAAGLAPPDDGQFFASGGRSGIHSEHLGHLLAEMQILARSHPGATW